MSITEDVDRALAERDYPRAASLAAVAVTSGARDPSLFNLAAFAKSEAGDYEGALVLLHQGLEIAPTDHFLLYSIGFCLSRLERYDGALAAFDSALQVRPGAPAPLFQKGLILSRYGDEEGARAHYDAAIAADPNYEDPLAGRATIAALRGRFDEARAFAARALKIDPRQPLANLAIAKADLEEGDAEAVVRRLEPQLDNPAVLEGDRSLFFSTIGDAFDALDRRDEAFSAWSEGKALSRRIFAERDVGLTAAAGTARLETFIPFARGLTPMPSKPPATPRPAAPREHVFLLGFPRSGTTLLEQVLAGHPDIVTLEERPFLEAAVTEFLKDKASFERLLGADDALLDPFRDLYWQLVDREGLKPRGKVFVDKMPLYSLNLPLIARMFPGAKILFAERDPRDVVFSCFRRAFQVNAGMYQFTSLESAARFYDLTMTAARIYMQAFPMEVRPTRHETLVTDFEGESRALCDFLGLEWTEALTRFAERARKRRIRTPSAPQVRRGLYATGIGQWRRYADHLAPVMPILERWAETLGYAAEPTA
jgi:tetratricopeptide (TPR) repeat protein